MKLIVYGGIIVIISSCEKRKGCTNPQAMNYDPSAEVDNGSCILKMNPSEVLTDQDGNKYATVMIGTQEWMADNLRSSRFCNGDPIAHVTDSTLWVGTTSDAWTYYGNDAMADSAYGKLYNWFSVNDPRNICPCGWRIPTDAEWMVLIDHLGGESVAGGKMKSSGIQYWQMPNADATNASGFSGLPGGLRHNNGMFMGLGVVGSWWSSKEAPTTSAWTHSLNAWGGNTYRATHYKRAGLSVRCIKD